MRATLTRLLNGLACVLLIAACGGGGEDGDGGTGPGIPVTTTDYTVYFSADQLVDGTAVPGSVTATASLTSARSDDIVATGSVTVSGATATAVTVNVGYAGENGPVALALANSGGNTWQLPSGTELDDNEYSRLGLAGYYVSIQTAQGELRGQILPPGWVAVVFDMDASGVVPSAISTGSAKAGFAFNPTTGQARARITVTGISDAISASIRNAIAGARGNVVIGLEQDATRPNVWGTIDINSPNSGNRLGTTGLDYLMSGRLYFSLETASNMEGELRAQILDESSGVLDIHLTDTEVVTAGSPVVSDATGVASVTWMEFSQNLAVAVTTDVQNAVSIAVHQGPAGEIGPLLITLAPDVTLPGNWFSPVTELTAEQAGAFQAGNTYVNVTTAQNPEGELRGQIVESQPGASLAENAM